MKILIKNVDIYLESSIIHSGYLIINGSIIESVFKSKPDLNETDYKVFKGGGLIVVPG